MDTRVSYSDIAGQCRAAGLEFRILSPETGLRDQAVTGRYRLMRLQSGLTLHATDLVECRTTTTEVVSDAGLTLTLFLSGGATIGLGGRPWHLAARPGAARAYLLARAEEDGFTRRGEAGRHCRKIGLSLPSRWLEEEDAASMGNLADLRRLAGRHGVAADWQPSAYQYGLAEALLAADPYGPLLHRLRLESQAMELLADMLQGLLGEPSDTSLPARDRQRLDRIDAYLGEWLDGPLHLADIARAAGMSVSALQRLIRQHHGQSVFAYARTRRLDQARHALERQKISVTEAAFIAGYSSAANFATAFKRHFGCSPGRLREK